MNIADTADHNPIIPVFSSSHRSVRQRLTGSTPQRCCAKYCAVNRHCVLVGVLLPRGVCMCCVFSRTRVHFRVDSAIDAQMKNTPDRNLCVAQRRHKLDAHICTQKQCVHDVSLLKTIIRSFATSEWCAPSFTDICRIIRHRRSLNTWHCRCRAV